MELTRIDFGYQKAIDRRQLWAQFVALYQAGESATLTPEENAMADAIRNENEIEDGYTGFIQKYYELDPTNTTWTTTTTDIVDQLTINGVTGANTTNIGLSLKKLGLERKRQRVNGIQETRWIGITRSSYGDKVRR